MDAAKDVVIKKKKKTLATRIWQQKELVLIALPFVIYILVFNYAP